MIFSVALAIVWAGAVLTLGASVLFILAGIAAAWEEREYRHIGAYLAPLLALFAPAFVIVAALPWVRG